MMNIYTYISFLDEATTHTIQKIQEKLNKEFGYSKYTDEWPPHLTVCFGNMLSKEEVAEVIKECEIVSPRHKPIQIQFEHVAITKREIQGEIFYSLRLKIKQNKDLERLSDDVSFIAEKYQIPFDAFTNDHYHVGLGRYSTQDLDEQKVSEIIDLRRIIGTVITSFSLFYSIVNEPKPEKAIEVARFLFKERP
ncbi:MAG: hypothetical protein NTZ13_03930 [Candidatus Parcubacteria bacterium]|nr:hypothetical protein [Candidatus Parcubacteria bacterium]